MFRTSPGARLRALALAALVLGTPGAASASGLRISPLQVDLGPQQASARLELDNAGDTDTVVDIRVLAWSQIDGRDELRLTDEVIAVPPVVRIAGGKKQAIRVGFPRQPAFGAVERSYRLQVTELPPPAASGIGQQLQLRLLLPVFVAPATAPQPATLLRLRPAVGGWQLEAINSGNVHAKITGLSIRDSTGRSVFKDLVAAYALAGSTVRVPVAVPVPAGGIAAAEAQVMHGARQQALPWPVDVR